MLRGRRFPPCDSPGLRHFACRDAENNAHGKEKIGRLADDGAEGGGLQQLLSDVGFHAAAKQDALREKYGHGATPFQKRKPWRGRRIHQEARRQAVIFEAHASGKSHRPQRQLNVRFATTASTGNTFAGAGLARDALSLVRGHGERG